LITKHKGALKEVIFLLGAGASVDAGMPMVKQLTEKLRKRLPDIPDINGNSRPEFSQVFDLIEAQDSSVTENYERLFEWIKLLLDVQKDPFRRIFAVKLDQAITNAMNALPFVIGGEVARLLESCQSEPSYLAKFADFIPAQGRLKVFSLNYDCCLEDACQSAGVELTTGFDLDTKTWNPSLFWREANGINLYKLHGSLRWHVVQDESRPIELFHLPLMELKSEQCLPSDLKMRQEPELVLGPGNKLQPDDPFHTLFYEFHRSIRQAQVFVIIGYSYGDPHINSILERVLDAGGGLLDVNPGTPSNRYMFECRYHHLRLSARSALVHGKLRSELERLST
jgi:hypothetical protein